MSKPYGFSDQTLQDFLEATAQTNEVLIKSKNSPNPFKYKPVSPFILSLCTRLNLPPEVKFLSIAIFEKFINATVIELHHDMTNDPLVDWTSHLQKLKSQTILRVMTSIQLANKVCSNNHLTKCSEIKMVLGKLGCTSYGLFSIMSSELRVMKCLEYRLSLPTPFTFMEVLLEVLEHNEPQIESKILRAIGINVLECFYCEREDIYDRLYESMTGRSRDVINRNEFNVIEKNLLFLAASVVVAAGYLYDNSDKNVHKVVLDSISVMTKMDKNDLEDFSAILCHFSIFPEC